MAERPILFTDPMVRAILDGRKTQTRRVVKPPRGMEASFAGVDFPCPYGVPGDRLWVREAWRLCHLKDEERYCYHAEGICGGPWRPSIHMPRWASRITLEITDVRVQRVQEISEADAKEEGAMDWWNALLPATQQAIYGGGHGPRHAFALLWDSINASRGYPWDANPWVWAITFKRVEARNA